MITLKIAGGALIIGATSLIGFFCSRGELLREGELLEMKRALTFLKNEIRFALSTFGEAAITVSERSSGAASSIFGAAGAEALRRSGAGACEIWQNAVENAARGTYLADEDVAAFKALGNSLGCLDKQAQTDALDLVNEYIDAAVSEIRRKHPSQSKMYRSLGFLSGALLTVILL